MRNILGSKVTGSRLFMLMMRRNRSPPAARVSLVSCTEATCWNKMTFLSLRSSEFLIPIGSDRFPWCPEHLGSGEVLLLSSIFAAPTQSGSVCWSPCFPPVPWPGPVRPVNCGSDSVWVGAVCSLPACLHSAAVLLRVGPVSLNWKYL